MNSHNHLLKPAHQPYLSPDAVIARNWTDGEYCPDENAQKHLAAVAPYILERLPVSFIADTKELPITWAFYATPQLVSSVRLKTFLTLEPEDYRAIIKFLQRAARPRFQPLIDPPLMASQILSSQEEAASRYRSERASLHDA